jgi:hypothetical protein
MSGDGSVKESPVSTVLPGSFYKKEPKNTLEEEAEITSVVVMPHRSNGSMNGAVDMGVN